MSIKGAIFGDNNRNIFLIMMHNAQENYASVAGNES
jgi:hypothetical protein